MSRSTYYFAGRVQGVGFRYTAQHLARDFPSLTGYVRNLPDGRVELVVEGPDPDAAALVASIRRHLDRNIERTDVTRSNATHEFNNFSIRN